MRLFKKTAALVMVFMMLVTAMSSFTLASANAVVDKFEVKEFSVLNSTGGNNLAAGDVTVNVTLQRVKGDNNTTDVASVIAAVYSNGALVDVAASKKAYPFTGTTQVNEMNLTIPTGTVEPELKVFLWNGDMITPIAKPSDEAKITSIKVGGVEVAGFDAATTYNVTLPAGTPDEPAVKVVASGLVDADVAYNADKTAATITVGANVYTVNYTINKVVGALTDVSYTSGSTYVVNESDAQNTLKLGTVKPNLVAADFYDEETGDYTKTINNVYGVGTYNGLDNYVTPVVSNRYPYWFYMDLPEKFVGMNYIAVPYNNDTVYAGDDTITFTTNKNVRFYVSSSPSWVDSNGVLDGNYTFNCVREGDSTATTRSYKDLKTTSTNANYTFPSNVYKYEITIPEGQTSATATIKVRSAGTWDFPHIFYEFIEETADESLPLPTITNATYTGFAGGTEELKLAGPTAAPTAAQLGDTTRTFKDIFGITSDADIVKYFTPTTSNRYPYWFMLDLPQKYVGKQQMLAGYNLGGQAAYTQQDTFTFTTDRNVRVYYSCWPNWVDTGAKDEGTMTVHLVKPGAGATANTAYDTLAASAVEATYQMYSYDIIVPEDKSTVTVTLKTRTPKDWAFPAIFYEAIE